MIIVMRRGASAAAIGQVVAEIRACGLNEHLSEGVERTIIGVLGDERRFDDERFATLSGVERAVRILHDWRIVSREAHHSDSMINVRGVVFGGAHTVRIVAQETANTASANNADALLFDPFFTPSRPYEALNTLSLKEQTAALRAAVAQSHRATVPAMIRIRDVRHIETVLDTGADILYLGGEFADNAALAREVGRLNTPLVLCKNKHHNTDDWLRAAERIALHGNHQIILGEAGTLNLHQTIPNRLDCEALAIARALSHLPRLANLTGLSNAYQHTEMLAKMAVAAGANALIIPA